MYARLGTLWLRVTGSVGNLNVRVAYIIQGSSAAGSALGLGPRGRRFDPGLPYKGGTNLVLPFPNVIRWKTHGKQSQ